MKELLYVVICLVVVCILVVAINAVVALVLYWLWPAAGLAELTGVNLTYPMCVALLCLLSLIRSLFR